MESETTHHQGPVLGTKKMWEPFHRWGNGGPVSLVTTMLGNEAMFDGVWRWPMLQVGTAGRTEDTEGTRPPPPLQGWSLGALMCSPGPAGLGPSPGTNLGTSPLAKSMCWPEPTGLLQPPPEPPFSNRTLPLEAVTGQGGQGASSGDRGKGVARGIG